LSAIPRKQVKILKIIIEEVKGILIHLNNIILHIKKDKRGAVEK
jgi:hypothetical protein